ncbi:ferric reductase-like transmembrane domain-containing protein [Desulforhopalus sp. IMCC35007]|uniref:ferric reductase-like transmembrane domain-containing protein n=1 Tax=Desulforhopalus sp. IMCC35007 TaxID=2569543 RepID=UPI00145C5C0C|nr:ferric reductase-like transmembrane domain-containing protein [Desulforhopalus sp. IMCC35007]
MEYFRKYTSALIFLLALACALSLPYLYESQTLWYKIGLDKTLLRLGQISGMIALVLLFSQIVLAVAGRFLEKSFGLKNIMAWHRANGLLILFFAVLHVLLILVPEGLENLPIGFKFWPEMVGALLFWIILAMVISSRYRQALHLDYRRWRAIHKPLGYLTPVIIVVHVLYVSDSFSHNVPKTILLLAFALLCLRVFWVKGTAFLQNRKDKSV